VIAVALYESPWGERVRALKYEQETHWARPLGHALGALVPTNWLEAAVVPVPLHPERLAERGYNQAALLARAVARRAGLVVDFDVLTRVKQTQAQAHLDKAARARNAAEAFVARPSRPGRTRFILLDDVMTTGVTLDACAAALRERGHEVLGALAVARADDA
jgi:ComF family protein